MNHHNENVKKQLEQEKSKYLKTVDLFIIAILNLSLLLRFLKKVWG